MTAPDEKKPPAFYCPKCGQKHRADLSGLVGKEGAVMKTHCVGCGLELGVSLDEDELPRVQALEISLGEAPPEETPKEDAPKDDTPAAPVPKKKSGSGAAPVARKRGSKAPKRKRGKDKDKAKERDRDAVPKGDTDLTSEQAEEAVKASTKASRDEVFDAEFSPGDQIGRYQVESAIGRGGTSEVYGAFDATTNRTVAVKVLLKDQSETMRQRFLREIEVQANIRHQNIMPVFDRGELDDGRPFFTMELLYKPWSLSEVVQARESGTLHRYTTLRELGELNELIAKVLVPVCDGIYVANVENGVIHRDLKPDNVLVDSRTLRPYVIDFGICHVMEKKGGLSSGAVIDPTAEDAGIVGTPRFLAPEQAKGNTKARTDVWGLGALLHFCVTGEPPLAGAAPITRAELKRRIKALEEAKEAALAEGKPKRAELCDEKLGRLQDEGLRTIESIYRDARDAVYQELPPSTPSSLRAVINKAMSKTTSDRYVNARQLSTEVQSWLKGSKVRALSQAGGSAAAVETAKRALSAHLVTLVWILLGLAGGFMIGKVLAGDQAIGASTRVDDALVDTNLLEERADELKSTASTLTPVEAYHFWKALEERADAIAQRVSQEPASDSLTHLLERLRFVRDRFAAPRVVFNVPEGTKMTGRNVVTNKTVSVRPGENKLAPGAYDIRIGATESVRVPVRIPLTIRDKNANVKLEPALASYDLPVPPDSVPAGMVLVLGEQVRPRDAPYTDRAARVMVSSFLMDKAEVTNSAYAQFLLSFEGADEAMAHAPASGFVPDPDSGRPVVIDGKENLPVVDVTPESARAYAAWRSKRDGANVRLPSEAEWVLAAGAALGYVLPNNAMGHPTEGAFTPPFQAAGIHQKDTSPYGVRGLLANAREMVVPSIDSEDPGAVLVKGAGVGDDPDAGAIYLKRVLGAKERHKTTGFRCVREIAGGS